MSDLTVRPIRAEQTRPLRQRVLRPHQRVEELRYPGDDAPDTLHVGGFLDERLIGVASIYREPEANVVDAHAWRLRGMAVDAEFRGRGYGAALLDHCIRHAVARGGTTLWCNARVPAAGFYRRLGFAVKGDEFELPGIGPHSLMWRPIG